MKAVRIYQRGTPDVMQVEDTDLPQPKAGEVLIQVAAAGVNFSDVGQRRGDYPNLVDLPATLGNEAAGVVVARGEGVSFPVEGTRVVALVGAGYAEYAVAAAQMCIPLPAGVSFEEATVIPIQGQTAYLLLEKAGRIHPGDRVLIHAAAGGVGSLAIQIAKRLGAGLVIGTDINPEKLAFVRALGADHALNTNDPTWMGQVMQATRGEGVDIVLEPIGGTIGQQSIMALAPFGRMIAFGSLKGEMTPMVTQMLIQKCLSVTGYNTVIQPLEDKLRASDALLRWIAAGELKVTLDHSYPLVQAADAHRALEASQTRGKVVLTLN
jgi:NADPH2:quinone reductase